MGQIVGIDLGTTFSAVAAIGPLGKPEIIANRDGERITPSVVLFADDDTVLVGSAALRSAPALPLDVVQFVKRHMGNRDWRFETSTGRQFSPEEISGLVLRRLKEDAETHLGEPVTDAVITVPAYFDDAQRRATRDAGKIAGLNVLRVLNEPTAAALAFGLDTEANGTFMVFDLGGGTFDVTVIRIGDGTFDVLGTDGLHELGGFEWDNRLMTWLNEEFQRFGGSDLMEDFDKEAELREKAELAKRSLSQSPVARIALAGYGMSKIVSVGRRTFEALTVDLVNQARDLCLSVMQELRLGWDHIDGILLVGGSTRMPMIRQMLEDLSGRPILRGGNPDELVALGAAVQAGLEAAKREPSVPGPTANGRAVSVRDVTSHGLGTIALDDNHVPRNFVLIPRNTKIPAKRSDVFTTAVDGQPEVRVVVTQGDDEDPAFVKRLGPTRGNVFPIPEYPAGTPIRVTYAYDIDQTVQIEITDLTAEESLGSFEVDSGANLSEDDVELARKQHDEITVG